MVFHLSCFVSSVWLVVCSITTLAGARPAGGDPHIEVAMRMIGHEVLLRAGDSTSRVFPVESMQNRYRIRLDTEFEFNPDELVATVSEVVKKSKVAEHYIVQVEQCETAEVVYSYEVSRAGGQDMVPCKTRDQAKACYNIVFTILDDPLPVPFAQLPGEHPVAESSVPGGAKKHVPVVWVSLGLVALVATGGFFLKRGRKTNVDPDTVCLGKYRFDTRNMELHFQDERTELSSKEAELLLFLYTHANTTLDREAILNAVWGDEGDYVGRTLDVFISKLRKKLEGDARIRIANIRGVGYRLILNDRE